MAYELAFKALTIAFDSKW